MPRGQYDRFKCPEKGCDRRFKNIIGLGIHRAKGHGIAGAFGEAMGKAHEQGLYERSRGDHRSNTKIEAFTRREARKHNIEVINGGHNERSLAGVSEERSATPEVHSPFHGETEDATLDRASFYALGHVQSFVSNLAESNGLSESVVTERLARLLLAA